MTPRDVYVMLAELVVGYVFWPYRAVRRWKLRRTLRRKMKLLGMIPMALLFAHAAHAQQQQSDTLIGTALSRAVIPAAWSGGLPGIYCLTWIAEKPARSHLLIIIDAEPADLDRRPICPDPDGGFYPFWIDGPTCPPGNKSPFPERDFIIIRCAEGISRYSTDRPQMPKKAQ